MEDFNQYLNANSAPEEQQAAQDVKDGLAALRLEEKVMAVAAQRRALHRRKKRWQWTALIAALILLMGAAWLFYSPKSTTVTPPAITPPPLPKEMINQTQEIPKATPEINQPGKPMAQALPAKGLAAPRYAAPQVMMRGNDTPNNDLQPLLNQVWYTHYPLEGLTTGNNFAAIDDLLKKRNFTSAYISLHRLEQQLPQNDTLRYLKGYCLLEMGQGEEALPYFAAVQGKISSWDAQLAWYRGLGLLQSGQKAAALSVFKTIAAGRREPYRAYASKAIGVVK